MLKTNTVTSTTFGKALMTYLSFLKFKNINTKHKGPF